MKKVLSVLITAALMLQLLVMFGAVSAAGSAAITVANASGTVGSTVTVEVGIANNPGFHALECQIEYDETMLELVSIEGKIGKAIPAEEDWDLAEPGFIAKKDESRFIYVDPRVDSPSVVANMVTGDITVATLTFKMLAKGTTNVTVKCEESLYLDASYEINQFVTNSGTGTVTIAEKPSVIYGDVNGDGQVKTNDLAMLRKYLASIDPATQLPTLNPETGLPVVNIKAGADCNGDGQVKTNDLAMLRKYLASIDPVTQLPSFTLGPR